MSIMGNMLDYIRWRGDLTLEQSPFNEVDNLILSQLVYVNFDGIVPPLTSHLSMTIREVAEVYFNRYSVEDIQNFGLMVRNSAELLKVVAKSPRFANMTLSKFENIVEHDPALQFSAMNVGLSDGTVFIAYRGTDSSIIGWKENFNMTYLSPIPAQIEAARYLEESTGSDVDEYPIRLGGHSKGGNLAIYAAVQCRPDIQSRILEVYNNDGPGFDVDFVSSEQYSRMRGRIRTFVPQSSIVGMLLEHESRYTVVKSYERIILQHDTFSWEVMGNRFVRTEEVTRESRLVEAAMKSWLKKLSIRERKQFVDALFQTFIEANIETVDDLCRAKWRKTARIIRALNQSQEHKVVIAKSLKKLFQTGRKVLKSYRKADTLIE